MSERALIKARLAYLDAYESRSNPPRNVLDGHDHTACANKERKDGYWHKGIEFIDGKPVEKLTFIEDESSKECKYDRRLIDPACAKAKCKQIGISK